MSVSPHKAWIHGISGRMGQKIGEAVRSEGSRFEYLGGSSLEANDYSKFDQTEILFDFSSSSGNDALCHFLAKRPHKSYAVLIGSTGIAAEKLDQWKKLAADKHLRLLIAPNTSLGVLVMAKAAKMVSPIAARHGFDIALVETHHKRKLDSPSGTAKFLAECVSASVSGLEGTDHGSKEPQAIHLAMHSIRGGGVYGEHELRFISDNEEINLSHRALSRDLFASGALVLGDWLLKRSPGVYGLLDIELTDLLD